MGRKCLTCQNPNRLAIDRQLVAGGNMSEISRKYGISYNSINYHRDHCISRQMRKYAETKEFLDAQTVATDFARLYQRLNALLDEAESKKRTSTFLEISKEIRSTSEFILRMVRTLESMREEEEAKECPCGGEYVVIDVSKLDDITLAKLMKLLEQAKTPDGKPIASAPVRDTLH